MPLATLLVPPALPAAAALATWGLKLAGMDVGRWVCAASAWLALAALTGGWFAVRVPLEVLLPFQVGAAVADVRVDALVVAMQLVVLLGLALPLTFRAQGSDEAALGALAGTAALEALASGSLGLTALGTGVAVSLCLLARRPGEGPGPFGLTAGWLALLWAAVSLEVVAGTSVFSAVPVTALQVPIFLLLLLAGVLLSGLVPWRTWVTDAAGSPTVAVLVPLGFFPLFRAYGLGEGQWPQPWLHPALAALGAATALAAATRAAGAPGRRRFLAETVAAAGGLALLALSLGTALGLAAALTVLGGLVLVAGLVRLVPERGPLFGAGVAVAVGVPPTLVFGGWLLVGQAALGASVLFAFGGLAAVLTWLLLLAAAARALQLPAGTEAGSPAGTVVVCGLGVVLGVALGVVVEGVAVPAATTLIAGSRVVPAVGGGPLGLATAAGGWAAVLLGGPLAALGLAAQLFRRRLPVAKGGAVPPLLEPGLDRVLRPVRRLAGLRPPLRYRSLLRLRLLETAAAGSHPWFWALLTLALALVVVR